MWKGTPHLVVLGAGFGGGWGGCPRPGRGPGGGEPAVFGPRGLRRLRGAGAAPGAGGAGGAGARWRGWGVGGLRRSLAHCALCGDGGHLFVTLRS